MTKRKLPTPKLEAQCCDCKSGFMAYNLKQKRCTDCQQTYRNTRRGYKYTRTCVDCGGSFKSKNGRAPRCKECWYNGACGVCDNKFKRRSQTKKYCSDKCSAIAKADYYYEGNYSKALIRDNWRCRKCETTENLQVHHIDHSGAENVKRFEANNSLENLITLCTTCHSEVHIMTDNYLVNKYKDEVRQVLIDYVGGEV